MLTHLGHIASLLVTEASSSAAAGIREEIRTKLDQIAQVLLTLVVCDLAPSDAMRIQARRRFIARVDLVVTAFCYFTLAFWILREEQSPAALFVPGFVTTFSIGLV